MDLNKIPKELHRLLPMVEKWGIPDDGERDSRIYQAPISELKELVKSLKHEDDIILDEWLCDDDASKNPSEEYVAYTCYLMAYQYARQILKDKDAL